MIRLHNGTVGYKSCLWLFSFQGARNDLAGKKKSSPPCRYHTEEKLLPNDTGTMGCISFTLQLICIPPIIFEDTLDRLMLFLHPDTFSKSKA